MRYYVTPPEDTSYSLLFLKYFQFSNTAEATATKGDWFRLVEEKPQQEVDFPNWTPEQFKVKRRSAEAKLSRE